MQKVLIRSQIKSKLISTTGPIEIVCLFRSFNWHENCAMSLNPVFTLDTFSIFSLSTTHQPPAGTQTHTLPPAPASSAVVLSPTSQRLHRSPTFFFFSPHAARIQDSPLLSPVFIFNAPSSSHFHLRSIYLQFSLPHTPLYLFISLSLPPLPPHSQSQYPTTPTPPPL